MIKNCTCLVFCLSLFAGCSTVSTSADLASCEEMDWFELGRSDGLIGKPSLTWQKRVAGVCKGFNTDLHRTYTNGWFSGVNQYCTKEHGFIVGRSGQRYDGVCPGENEKEFYSAYQQGQLLATFEEANKQINLKIQGIEAQLEEPETLDDGTLARELKRLLKQKQSNRKEISKIEAQVGVKTL